MDYLLRSVAAARVKSAVIAILTGMGRDGTDGCVELARTGCTVLAQDRESCTVYGMPKAVFESGLADAVVPLDQMAATITEYASPTG